MTAIKDVEKLTLDLHNQKIIDLDRPLRDLLKPEGIGFIDPDSPLADNAIAWSDYVLITKGKTGSLDDLLKVAETIRTLNAINPR
ncbi:MAG: hypothetical protein JKY60_17120 [Kordiimonadaceae bacterium]|nr:hypothetical protein [Kordiimonadaceae bacterium]